MIDSDVYRRPTRSSAWVLTKPTARITSWQPLAQMMLAGWVLVIIGGRSGALLWLSVAAAAVAATTAFVFDDPAAETLAASPCSLPRRRLQRATIALLGVGIWWVPAVLLARRRAGDLSGMSVVDATLEVGVFVAIALAVSATACRLGDRTGGGIAGAVTTMACFATTFLPHRRWLPLPADGAPNPTRHLLVLLAVAVAGIVLASTDPAHRRPSWERSVASER
ncbi:MAG TPA: hypothetical protein VMM60_10175 [Ilumatobacter sp.]|nr:hypothetical protein [Ilumatobacter sp.]